jgi:hypothetical protein
MESVEEMESVSMSDLVNEDIVSIWKFVVEGYWRDMDQSNS